MKKRDRENQKGSETGSAGTNRYFTIFAWPAVFLYEKPPTDGAVSEQSLRESKRYAIS
ncbi:MAG: hypothetical protein ACLT16_20700 [[Clostridium] innocuum]